MITKDDKQFKKQMNLVIDNLELDKYSNNKTEHMDHLKKFL